MQSLGGIGSFSISSDPAAALFALGLSFVLSTVIAFTYARTFQGLSYSRGYLQSLVLSSIVTSLAMLAIGDSLARGLGMMGALGMVRFRSNLKDPRDLMFVFASLAVGIASGVHNSLVAVLGTAAFCLAVVILYRSPLSARNHFDGLLRFHMDNTQESRMALEKALQVHCEHFALITLRDIAQGRALDYAYQVKIRNRFNQGILLDELKQVPTVRGLSLLLQETTVEV